VSNAAIAAAVFGATAVVSWLLVSRTIPLLDRLGLVDRPGPRRAHQKPVPRGVGPAMFLAFAFGLALTYSFSVSRFPEEHERLLLLLAGTGLITGVMVYDDAIGLRPLPKLGWQVVAAALVVLPRLNGSNHGIVIEQFNSPFGGTVELPLLLALGFTLFWIVGMVNTINWVDGLDGLAASVTLVACAILFAHTFFWPAGDPQFTISLLPAVLAGAVVGFLPFNWHPAKAIMGDSGAHFLGFCLAIIAIIGGAKIATALLALALPILDVAWVIFYRIVHRRSPLDADRGHLHHRLADSGWGPARVVLFVAGFSLVSGFTGLLLPSREAKLAAIVAVGVVLLGTVALLALRDRHRPSTASREEPTAPRMTPG
jgi:UDP-N-acetylmuramyl pentapeptide phosphotransferase/UDP-N-acetylglucosamine-1-phosphate transferase